MQGELFRKGILRDEYGIFIIRQSMPYPLAENNALLVESSDGWTVIDAGVDMPLTRSVWQQAVKEVGIQFHQIKRIIITHCHPDHLGAAGWLQQRSDAPVYMLQEEIDRAGEFIFLEKQFTKRYREAIAGQVQLTGFDVLWMERLIDDWYQEVSPLYPRPVEVLPLDPGSSVDLQGYHYQVIPAPVHADGQFLLWSPQTKRLLAADLISTQGYLHFSDWPNTHQLNPLRNLINIHEYLQSLDICEVIPGHGPIIYDLPQQMERLMSRHRKKLQQVQGLVHGPVTAAQIYPQTYDLIDYVHLHRVVMGETIGYLEMLKELGWLISFEEDSRIWYTPAKR